MPYIKKNLHFFCIILTMLFSLNLWAKTFQNSYIRFNLPDQWSCSLKDKAYICRHKVAKSCLKKSSDKNCKKQIRQSKEAVIIMAAKEKSQMDSLKAYYKYFSQPKKIKTTRSSSQSKVIHTKKVKIKKQPWVDSMQLSSELPYYYTRYLASIKGNVAVLITFSAHKLYYTQYSSDFFKSIKSLQIVTPDISTVKKYEIGNKTLSRPLDLPQDLLQSPIVESASGGSSSSNLLFALAFILATLGIYVWIKGQKK